MLKESRNDFNCISYKYSQEYVSLMSLQRFGKLIESVSEKIDPVTLRRAKTVQHGIWELAFERVLLDLVERNAELDSWEIQLITDLALDAEIVEEGVLDPDSWKIFSNWLNTKE